MPGDIPSEVAQPDPGHGIDRIRKGDETHGAEGEPGVILELEELRIQLIGGVTLGQESIGKQVGIAADRVHVLQHIVIAGAAIDLEGALCVYFFIFPSKKL